MIEINDLKGIILPNYLYFLVADNASVLLLC